MKTKQQTEIQWTRHETDAAGLRSPHWTATYRNRQAIVAEVDFSWVVYGGPREDCGHARSLKTAKQIAVRRMIGGAS